jgi:hypothetical protein
MKCTRCEVLGREQQSDELYYIDDFTPICSVCLQEVKDEELYLLYIKEYEQGSESVAEEDS